jgi:hypothetical protein
MTLLGINELKSSKKLLLKSLSIVYFAHNPDDFTAGIKLDANWREKLFSSIKKQIIQLYRIDSTIFPYHLMDNLNTDLNIAFSDDGWRKIKREIAQIKKRAKKKRIELSIDLIKRLQVIQKCHQLKTYDDVIDLLISDHAELKELKEDK